MHASPFLGSQSIRTQFCCHYFHVKTVHHPRRGRSQQKVLAVGWVRTLSLSTFVHFAVIHCIIKIFSLYVPSL